MCVANLNGIIYYYKLQLYLFFPTSALSKAELRIYQDLAASPVSQDDLFREPVSLDMTTI